MDAVHVYDDRRSFLST